MLDVLNLADVVVVVVLRRLVGLRGEQGRPTHRAEDVQEALGNVEAGGASVGSDVVVVVVGGRLVLALRSARSLGRTPKIW